MWDFHEYKTKKNIRKQTTIGCIINAEMFENLNVESSRDYNTDFVFFMVISIASTTLIGKITIKFTIRWTKTSASTRDASVAKFDNDEFDIVWQII